MKDSADPKIEFNRPAKYTLKKKLGSGACGETVLLRDEGMDCDFVAKKYNPALELRKDETLLNELLKRFRDEARILFRLSHPNIVRVYNYFDYPIQKTGYILMEHVAGEELIDFLKLNPNQADQVFEGVVSGFAHLQDKKVLHRDIRPANLLVDSAGVPKIIDFGFGKDLGKERTSERQKSISLNWWCETPPEFDEGIYDYQTEVYFVGKLFEKAIIECSLSDFKYRVLVGRTCESDRAQRIENFLEVRGQVKHGKFAELSFSDDEKLIYRKFSAHLSETISQIQEGTKFQRNVDEVQADLERLYRTTQLEVALPEQNKLAKIFVLGTFW